MLKYKLTAVYETERLPQGARYPVKSYHEEYIIGYFESEEALFKWCEQNRGELAKSEYEEIR